MSPENRREIEGELIAARRRLARLDPLHELRGSDARKWRRLEDAVVHAMEDGEGEVVMAAISAWERFGRRVLTPAGRARSDNRSAGSGVKSAPKRDEKRGA